MPFVAARHGGKSVVTVVSEGAVLGKWPGDDVRQVAHYFPMGEEKLCLFRVGKLQRA